MKTYPYPGQTKFDLLPMAVADASRFANEHWDVDTLSPSDQNGAAWNVKTRSGFVAMIGNINGKPHMLTKLPDGGRELQPL